ncbi:MAG: DUF167 domain-containing protein [Phycisphaerae bacterium]
MLDSSKVKIDATAEGVEFCVKATPGASRTRIAGVWSDRVRIAVAAPPEGGKANAALRRFLAELLNVPIGNVHIAQGESSPLKRVRIAGTSVDQVRRAIRGL